MIQGTTGRIWVDDEDEFAAHRVALGYPDEVIEQAVTSCQEVLRRVTDADGALRRVAPGLARPAASALTRPHLSSPVSRYLGRI